MWYPAWKLFRDFCTFAQSGTSCTLGFECVWEGGGGGGGMETLRSARSGG